MNEQVTSKTPLVSVMMPTYNVKEYLSDAIDSVLQQTFSDWELIIVDDGSTDGTAEVLEEYTKKDSRIKVYYQEHGGRGRARNKCLEYSQGKYIAVCDSDDISFPERFEKQVNFLKNNLDIGAVASQVCSFAEKPIFDSDKIVSWPTDPNQVYQGFKRGRMKMANCAAMIRTSLFHEYGGYCEELLWAQDHEFFRRITLKGIRLTNLPEVLVYYRKSSFIPDFKHYRKVVLYTEYANYRASGGNKSIEQFSQTITNKLQQNFLILEYLKFLTIMKVKKIIK